MELVGKVAIITAAGAGLGRTLARRLAAEGAGIVVADIDDAAGHDVVTEIEDRGARAAFVRADVRLGLDVERIIACAVERFGALDVLVNNAGGWGPTANFPSASPLEWGATLDLNLRGAMLGTQLALEPMRRRGGGAVVNIASSAGLGYAPYESPEYGAAKAGLIRFTTTLAGLREEMGIRVNCVVPDWILTERAEDELASMSPEERAAAPTPLPMDEVAEAVVHLIRDDELAGRVMVLRGGESPRLIAVQAPE
jgi:NAD(P)-dependent dehydrogenase (short-subunit alcohol dehydrogenase family)